MSSAPPSRYEEEEAIHQRAKSVPPRDQDELPSTRARQAEKYWKDMDDLFYKTLGHAERAFDINVKINIIVVGVGISLLAYSIVYSAFKNLDLYSTAFGSLGVLSFIALFYFTPQRKIQKTVGDLVQIQMLYRTFYMQAEAVSDYDYITRKSKTFDDVKRMNDHLMENAIKVIDKIEKCIGEEKSDEK
jgi:hypothetical protein